MERWVLYAIVSMFFAGFTSVVAKVGLTGISGELGLAVRTLFVAAFVLIFAVFAVPVVQFQSLNAHNYIWLGASGVTTAISWIFYYKALKEGDVATVALIDKGSVVVAIALAYFFLREHITFRTLVGAGLIVGGIIILARK